MLSASIRVMAQMMILRCGASRFPGRKRALCNPAQVLIGDFLNTRALQRMVEGSIYAIGAKQSLVPNHYLSAITIIRRPKAKTLC